MFGLGKKLDLPKPEEALPGRDRPMPVPAAHFVNGQIGRASCRERVY